MILNTIKLTDFYGKYIGNVQRTFLGIGNMMKTGCLDVLEEGEYVKIKCWSKFNPEMEVKVKKRDMEPYFSNKKETIHNDDGSIEERVSFMHYKDDNYGILNTWLGGLTCTIYAYQFKFLNGIFTSFRIQKYNSGNEKKLLYLLEVKDVEKIQDIDKKTKEIEQEKVVDERKSDWNF